MRGERHRNRLGELQVSARSLGLTERIRERLALVVGALEAVYAQLTLVVHRKIRGGVLIVVRGPAVFAVAHLHECQHVFAAIGKGELGSGQTLVLLTDLDHPDAEGVDLGLVLFGVEVLVGVRVVAVLQLRVVHHRLTGLGVLVHRGGVGNVDLPVSANLLVVEVQGERGGVAVRVLAGRVQRVCVTGSKRLVVLAVGIRVLRGLDLDDLAEGQTFAFLHHIGDQVLLVDGVARVDRNVGVQVEVHRLADGSGVGTLVFVVFTGVDIVIVTTAVDDLVHARLGALGHDRLRLDLPLLGRFIPLGNHVRGNGAVHIRPISAGDLDVVAADRQVQRDCVLSIARHALGIARELAAVRQIIKELRDVADGLMRVRVDAGVRISGRIADDILIGLRHGVIFTDVLAIVLVRVR